MDEKDEQPTQLQQGGGKPPRTRTAVRKAIEGELNEARLKEAKGKLKQLITELAAARKVVSAKEDEIESLFDDYADVITE